jgi:hypothetical protein
MRKIYFIFIFIVSGCTTAYGPNGLTGGFKEKIIDEDSYLVSFFGNGYTGEQQVWNYWIYRCAELTIDKGYKLFSLNPSDKHALLKDPDTFRLVEFVMDDGDPDSMFRPVQYYYYSVTKYLSKGVVDMYNTPIPEGIDINQLLDAEYIIQELKPYIDSKAKISPPDRKLLLIKSTVEAAIKAKMLDEVEAKKLRSITI